MTGPFACSEAVLVVGLPTELTELRECPSSHIHKVWITSLIDDNSDSYPILSINHVSGTIIGTLFMACLSIKSELQSQSNHPYFTEETETNEKANISIDMTGVNTSILHI